MGFDERPIVSEQAAPAALESNGLSDLASFLDTPDVESDEENEATLADELTGDEADTDSEAPDEQDDDTEGDDPEEKEAAPVAKITFKVKGEDGEEQTIEATPEELAKSYMRQSDYTSKTQALAKRENDAVQFLTQKHDEIRANYLSQAELSRAAVVNMAGIKTEQEMAYLAQSDPAAWVAENQRQQQINNYLNNLDRQIQGEKQSAKQQAEERDAQFRQKAFTDSWNELQKDGIDKSKLTKIYGDVNKNYGFSNEELGNVYDYRLVRMMKDAAAYRDLQAQKSVVTKKVQEAPRMPSRQNAPANERADKALDNRFKTGRAKLNDLAAFLR